MQTASYTNIFKKASTTYYYSSLFFPASVLEDVTAFYAFVRTADDFVDAIPQQEVGFTEFVRRYKTLRTKSSGQGQSIPTDPIIRSMIALQKKHAIGNEIIDSFLDAMKADLHKSTYKKLTETIAYMYGSAEVIGLVMAHILQLPKEAYPTAQMQGRAMQYINFIRDVAEDNELGRQYIPVERLESFGLTSLSEQEAKTKSKAFVACIREQIEQYQEWQEAASAGYAFLPYRYRVPVMIAAAMYSWTARKIYHDPFIIYTRKVKPSKVRVIATGIYIAIREGLLFNSRRVPTNA